MSAKSKYVWLENVPDASIFRTVREAAEEFKVSEASLRVWLAQRMFTTYKFKSLTLLSVEELKKYLT
jgi:phage antirepressor YoqD-like protein